MDDAFQSCPGGKGVCKAGRQACVWYFLPSPLLLEPVYVCVRQQQGREGRRSQFMSLSPVTGAREGRCPPAHLPHHHCPCPTSHLQGRGRGSRCSACKMQGKAGKGEGTQGKRGATPMIEMRRPRHASPSPGTTTLPAPVVVKSAAEKRRSGSPLSPTACKVGEREREGAAFSP